MDKKEHTMNTKTNNNINEENIKNTNDQQNQRTTMKIQHQEKHQNLEEAMTLN